MIPIFKNFPELKKKLAYVALGEFPTPVQKLSRLGEELQHDGLYVKKDNLSSSVYGGNKVRKLEFILGDAVRSGKRETLTFGFAGSNHALATTIFGGKVGLKSILMLLPQHNAGYVRRNLLADYYFGAELHQQGNTFFLAINTFYQMLRHVIRSGRLPYVIPPGGSSILGVIGFVNAAMELKEQIEVGQIIEPDYIYVPAGSTGTAVGLMIGLRASGLRSEVVLVRVADSRYVNSKKIIRLLSKTNYLLRRNDPSFPIIKFSEKDVLIRHDFFGKQYGLFTQDGLDAILLLKKEENIELEGTYTGKTFAALLHDVKSGFLKRKSVLFWNTYNNRDISYAVDSIDYHKLPVKFHDYFTQTVQPLDVS